MTDESSFLDPRPLHRAFFRAASQWPEGSPEYRGLLAGLLVVRLLDKWPDAKATSPEWIEMRHHDFRPVQDAVAALDDAILEHTLSALIEAILRFSVGERVFDFNG